MIPSTCCGTLRPAAKQSLTRFSLNEIETITAKQSILNPADAAQLASNRLWTGRGNSCMTLPYLA